MKRASQVIGVIGPGAVVRLACYRPMPGVSDERFIQAFEETAVRGPRPPGLLYRDLCRQVPAWNQQIAAEIQTPNPYDFIDYTILRAGEDAAALPALPEDVAGSYERTEALYTVTSRFAHLGAEGEPEVVLYNLFEVDGPPAAEEGFAAAWPLRGEYQSQQPGFYSAALHRRLLREARVAAFNRAEWLSTAAYAATLAGFEQRFPRAARSAAGAPGGQAQRHGPPPVRSHLGLFRRVAVTVGA